MCVAIPGKITAIDGDTAAVSFGGTEMKVNVSMVDAAVGDYVLVHAGCAIEVMTEDKAQELIDLFNELEEII
ncbi:MAG: HypC/HybG/HupF family hydrogenase formation chaperone [Bacillota bacterium]|jgi:hydrogenase expression/formation protein HypC